eukprot:13019331-Ditylum_brightwellii.AAC.1
MGKVQRRVTPTRSASTISSPAEKGRSQIKNAHSLRPLRIPRHSAIGEQLKNAGETNKHIDAEMKPVEETETDNLKSEGKQTKAPGKDETTSNSETNHVAEKF